MQLYASTPRASGNRMHGAQSALLTPEALDVHYPLASSAMTDQECSTTGQTPLDLSLAEDSLQSRGL